MGHKVSTVIREMMSASGRDEGEVNAYIGKDEAYLSSVLSGKSRLSPTGLAGIAEACGFKLVATDGVREYEIAPAIVPDASVGFETTGEVHECEYSGLRIAKTRSVFGLSDAALEALMVELGASYVPRFGKKSADLLVVGSDVAEHGGSTKATRDAERWGKPTVGAEEFISRAEEVVGRRIVAR